MFYVLLSRPRPAQRRARVDAQGRACRPTFHYLPLHTSDAGRTFAARPTECPVSEDISGRLLRLPFYNNLSEPRPRPRGRRAFLDVARSPPCRSEPGWRDRTAGLVVAAAAGLLVAPRPRRAARRPCWRRTSGRPRRTLDVGSADAPSVGWMRGEPPARDASTCSPTGSARRGGRAGRRPRCRSRTGPSTWSSAFDVVEHCEDDALAVSELPRVLVPGGPDAAVGARPTSGRGRTTTSRPVTTAATRARGSSGWSRAPGWRCCGRRTPSAAVFPLFAAERLRRRLAVRPPAGDSRLPEVSPGLDRVADGLCRAEARAAAPARPALRLVGVPGGRQARVRPALTHRRRGRPRGAPSPRPRPRRTRRRRVRPAAARSSAAAPRRPRATARPQAPATRPGGPAPARPPSAPGWPGPGHTRREDRGVAVSRRRRCRRRPARSSAGPGRPPSTARQHHDHGPQHREASPRAASGGPRTRPPRRAPVTWCVSCGTVPSATMYGARNSASVANSAVTSRGEPPSSASTTGPPVSTPCAMQLRRRSAAEERERAAAGPRRRPRRSARRRRPQHATS